jgi:cation:H+ antiporter
LLLGLSAYFLKEGGALLGGVYVLLLIAYLAFSYMQDKKGNGVVVAEKANEVAHFEEDVQADPAMKMWKAILFSVGGIAVLIGGAKLLVLGSVDIARTFGVPEAVIGLTLVAVGTSLPELATGVIASFKRHSDVILGNILGSCIFNILAILGITMLFSPIPFTSQIADFDTWLMIAVTLVLLPVVLTGRVISRIEGGIFLTIYIAYTAWLFLGG